jgi:hypothetical protein
MHLVRPCTYSCLHAHDVSLYLVLIHACILIAIHALHTYIPLHHYAHLLYPACLFFLKYPTPLLCTFALPCMSNLLYVATGCAFAPISTALPTCHLRCMSNKLIFLAY